MQLAHKYLSIRWTASCQRAAFLCSEMSSIISSNMLMRQASGCGVQEELQAFAGAPGGPHQAPWDAGLPSTSFTSSAGLETLSMPCLSCSPVCY